MQTTGSETQERTAATEPRAAAEAVQERLVVFKMIERIMMFTTALPAEAAVQAAAVAMVEKVAMQGARASVSLSCSQAIAPTCPPSRTMRSPAASVDVAVLAALEVRAAAE